MEEDKVIKIVVLGPESTGKSTLCQQLANYYNTEWCAEFAREYLLTYGINYTFADLETIAKGQLALEEEAVRIVNSQWSMVEENRFVNTNSLLTIHHLPLVFLDTDMYVMKVWCEYVFNKCHTFILNEISTRKYDLYLLCNIDLPWVQDELREYPDEKPRQELYKIYTDILINQTTPWVEISGNNEQRLQAAVKAVDEILMKRLNELKG
jgi:nicotinamide riboside kinase